MPPTRNGFHFFNDDASINRLWEYKLLPYQFIGRRAQGIPPCCIDWHLEFNGAHSRGKIPISRANKLPHSTAQWALCFTICCSLFAWNGTRVQEWGELSNGSEGLIWTIPFNKKCAQDRPDKVHSSSACNPFLSIYLGYRLHYLLLKLTRRPGIERERDTWRAYSINSLFSRLRRITSTQSRLY